jgi:hypothetical protein
VAKITEKKLYAVAPQAFTSNGTILGLVSIADTSLFVVGHIVIIGSSTQETLTLKIKRISSPTEMYVGTENTPVHSRTNISGYLVGDGAYIYANEQNRPNIPEQEIERNTYDEEPVIARRVVLVDKFGNKFGDDNPLPVNANVSIGDVNVQLDAFDSTPDSALSVGSEDGTKTGPRHVIKVASDGSVLARNYSSLVPEPKTKIDIISRNDNGDITLARFYNGLSIICDLELTYDFNGDLLSVERT